MRAWMLASLLAALPVVGCDVVPELRARAGYLHAALDGDVRLAPSPGTTSASSRVDVRDDLGVGASGSPFAELALDTALGRIALAGLRYSDDSDGALSAAFGDIPAGTPVRTEVELDLLRAMWAFDLVELGPLRVSPGVGVDWFDLDTKVASITPISVFERFQVTAPVPMLFVDSAIELGPVAAEATAGAMSLSLGDFDGTFVDLDAKLAWRPGAGAELFAGYRHVAIDAGGVSDGQDYDAELTLSGWFVGGGFRF